MKLLLFCLTLGPVLVAFGGELEEIDGFTHCERNFIKVGCYKDSLKDRPLREMLLNDRDKYSTYHDGHRLDWRKWDKSMHSLACRCAKKAEEKGYQYFGLQFFGECWSDVEGASRFYKDGEAPQEKCFQELGQDGDCKLTDDKECVGKQAVNYVYRVEKKSKTTKDGGYSEWTRWTECSKSCNKGVQFRERTCTSPAPSGGGRDCTELGSSEESRFCNAQKCEKACKKAMDLGIIMDSSSSVTEKNFDTVKAFVGNMLDEFEVAGNATHVGAIVYNHKAKLVFDFKKYTDSQSVARAVQSIAFTPGGTFTDKALRLAATDLYSEKGGWRKNNPHLLVVITDGKTNDKSQPYSTVLRPLKDAHVKTIAVGVGTDISRDELEVIAMGIKENVVMIEKFEDMVERVNAIVSTICGQVALRKQ